MDIAAGLTIDHPAVTVRWGASESDLQALMGPTLRHVTQGYWTASVQVLGGLSCQLGFHFDEGGGGLTEFEFFRESYSDQKHSFDEFQRSLEMAFGPPTRRTNGMEGFPSYSWWIGAVEIVHYVFDRFGPEEHMRIRRPGYLKRLLSSLASA
jgi:hypothetical protein